SLKLQFIHARKPSDTLTTFLSNRQAFITQAKELNEAAGNAKLLSDFADAVLAKFPSVKATDKSVIVIDAINEFLNGSKTFDAIKGQVINTGKSTDTLTTFLSIGKAHI